MSDASKIDDGGAAFPFEYEDNSAPSGMPYRLSHSGMTLRDYFAAAALTGMLTRSDYDNSTFTDVAIDALRYADALIAASKTGGPEHG